MPIHLHLLCRAKEGFVLSSTEYKNNIVQIIFELFVFWFGIYQMPGATNTPNIIQAIGLYNIGIWYNILRDFKKFTSKKIIESIKEEPESRREWILELFSKACKHLKREQEFKVWQDGYHAEELYSNKFIYQKLDYIH